MLTLDRLYASLDRRKGGTSCCDRCHIRVVEIVLDRANLVGGGEGAEQPMKGDGHWQMSGRAVHHVRN